MSSPVATSTQIVGKEYMKTLQGICKFVELLTSFIGVLLVSIDFYGYPISMFIIAAIISMVIALYYLIQYIRATPATASMFKTQFVFHFFIVVYYIIAVSVLLAAGYMFTRLIVGGVFGILATLAHLVDATDNFRKARST